jgi:hypothetical protein
MTAGFAVLVSLGVSMTAAAQRGGGTTRAGGAKGATSAAPSASAAASAASATTAAAPAASGSAGATTAAPAASGSAVAPAGSAAPVATNAGMTGSEYVVRLRDLESRVDELKDQIRRSHTRLALLSDQVLGGGLAGSRCEVGFVNEMSNAFKLTKAVFVIDGTVQYNKQDDTGALADQKDIPIFTGSIPPGDHTVQVLLNFQGNGYGVFTYLKGYRFEVKSSHSFTAVEGKTLQLSATALEKGGVTTPLEQRPAIEWHEKVQAMVTGPSAPAGAAPVAPAGGGGNP